MEKRFAKFPQCIREDDAGDLPSPYHAEMRDYFLNCVVASRKDGDLLLGALRRKRGDPSRAPWLLVGYIGLQNHKDRGTAFSRPLAHERIAETTARAMPPITTCFSLPHSLASPNKRVLRMLQWINSSTK